jgi:hemin uptake protein HemP
MVLIYTGRTESTTWTTTTMNEFSRATTLTLRRTNGKAHSTSAVSSVGVNSMRAAQADDERNTEGERVLLSEMLLQGAKHICIKHNGQSYRLHVTQYGKLILTK